MYDYEHEVVGFDLDEPTPRRTTLGWEHQLHRHHPTRTEGGFLSMSTRPKVFGLEPHLLAEVAVAPDGDGYEEPFEISITSPLPGDGVETTGIRLIRVPDAVLRHGHGVAVFVCSWKGCRDENKKHPWLERIASNMVNRKGELAQVALPEALCSCGCGKTLDANDLAFAGEVRQATGKTPRQLRIGCFTCACGKPFDAKAREGLLREMRKRHKAPGHWSCTACHTGAAKKDGKKGPTHRKVLVSRPTCPTPAVATAQAVAVS